jgi:hypothetical protein
MRLSQLTVNIDTELEFGGDIAKMTVRPSVITAEYEDRLRSAQSAIAIASALAELVAFVDIVDDDGKPIACTAESFARYLPVPVLMEMFKTAGMACRPDPQMGETSAAG